MTAHEFEQARKQKRLTQAAVARLLGVSQGYVALLVRGGKRPFPDTLARKAVVRLQMNPLALPAQEHKRPLRAEHFAKQRYPGFASMRSAWTRNPVQVSPDALAQDNLEARLTEALLWLLTNDANMSNPNRDWMLEQARAGNFWKGRNGVRALLFVGSLCG